MSNRAWMPLHIGDYLTDTGHLTATEHGAYLLLIMHYWQNGCLPKNERIIARIAKLRPSSGRRAATCSPCCSAQAGPTRASMPSCRRRTRSLADYLKDAPDDLAVHWGLQKRKTPQNSRSVVLPR
ncbi:YdaU family protein (plasmid) [Sinorhizobium sp. B11]|jgi:hypothetical protein